MTSLKPVLLLAVVALVALTTADEEKLLKKYGMVKIFESCFGAEETKEYMMKVKKAAMRCKSLPTSGHDSSRYQYSSNSLSSSSAFQQNSPMAIRGFDWTDILGGRKPYGPSSGSGNIQYVPIPVYVGQPGSRNKRQATDNFKYYNEDRVRSLTRKMKAKISNITCVMQELGYMGSNKELLYDNMIEEIQQKRGIDSELRQDLIEGVQDCKQITQCVPTTNLNTPFSAEMLRFKMFHKCNLHHKFTACMKKDLRSKRDQFDLNALDGEFAGAEDDEKMLSLLWAKVAVGGDDMMF